MRIANCGSWIAERGWPFLCAVKGGGPRRVGNGHHLRCYWWAVPTLLVLLTVGMPARAQESGKDIYMKRCFWCHGEQGRGDGPSAVGMFPRPRDLVRAEYKIRSTHHGQLPTDEDMLQIIARGMPGTPMSGWQKILALDERRSLVEYLKSLAPRFGGEMPDSIMVPSGAGSVERGKEIYRNAKCSLCHGEAGRGDGAIATTLNFEWGLLAAARDLTRGWTFKGGHEPRDIYLRITGGLNGTPMGPYRDLLSDQERWDLAHYIVSLDREPRETGEDFSVVAALIDGEIPRTPDSPEWNRANPVLAPLAGQVILDPPLRWWIPTVGSVTARSLWNGSDIGFLLEWDDPTGPGDADSGLAARASSPRSLPDSVSLQFAANEGSKPYFLFGDPDNSVKVWHWQSDSTSGGGGYAEEWTASGAERINVGRADFRVDSVWKEGRWHVLFHGSLDGQPVFEPGKFVPTLFSVRDGANGEIDNVRAISTWLYVTLERPKSARPWLMAFAYLLGAVIVELWILSRIK